FSSKASTRGCRTVCWKVTLMSLSIAVVLLVVHDSHFSSPSIPTQDSSGTLTLKSFKSTADTEQPIIYVITATYKRPEQIPELTRLGQTLLSVSRIHWIVGDDRRTVNQRVLDLLEFLGIPYTYLLTPMPEIYRNPAVSVNDRRKGWAKRARKHLPRGVANRMAGLDWVKQHASSGVVYFADDDNTYDTRLFEEMRYTKRVSMWPVGLMGSSGMSTPIIKKGKFVGWYDAFTDRRKFPVDMAGFAVSVELIQQVPNASMPFKVGYEETGFLESLKISTADIEFKADNCSKIYVWHTQTVDIYVSPRYKFLQKKYKDTNVGILAESIA
ncbi:galactosylgalactosylxylosylprotein 3-beta-glucuronosyltransferase P-like, partial [Penaeus indicus]|uniref:galactosylgalactosylxylosylprotein 3-beta-glucuronosyltransferase P-like n=1 Tax=Penaeus indicus TaxID=29960 RepID=UPI00300CB50A